MKTPSLLALSLLATPLAVTAQVTVFSDDFSSSTVNSTTPAAPTANSTSYQIISAKSYNPTPSIGANDLKFGIASTSSGAIEAQALFSSSPVALTTAGDYLLLKVIFNNGNGLLTANNLMGFGLYNSGGTGPVAGGLNGTANNSAGNTTAATGGAQQWQGYVAQIGYTGQSSRFMDRQSQTGTDNRNQDLVTSGSGSQSYGNPGAATIGSASTTPSVALTTGSQYTELLKITLTASGALQLDNNLFAGNSDTGTLLSTMTATTGTTPLTTSFDGLAVGWRAMAATTGGTVMDINSLSVNSFIQNIQPAPEPSSFALLSLGAATMVLLRRRTR